MTVVVIDIGTSSVRAVSVDANGQVGVEHREACLPYTTAAGSVTFDVAAMATSAVSLARRVIDDVVSSGGSVVGIGIANQRASTVVWDADTGYPVGPGLGWQDLRTVGRCFELAGEGFRVAPNMSATKAEWLVAQAEVALDRLRVGTIDSWIAWHLTDGARHVTDATNAAITGLADHRVTAWRPDLLDALGIPASAMPTIVPTVSDVGPATALPGHPHLFALVGDQQASLVGQGCVTPGAAKVTFGTGAMLDVVAGPEPVVAPDDATFPIVAWRAPGPDGAIVDTFGIEAVMLSAGTCVEWLRDGLGILDEVADAGPLAATVDSADGVVFVPALSGLGSPVWDHGARGLLVGLTRGTTRAHVVRAVLEGIAHRGVDLIEAAEAATGRSIEHLSIDGGMAANSAFVQALADAAARPITVAHQREATGLGAGLLAGVGAGEWSSIEEAAATVEVGHVVDPSGAASGREMFGRARDRAAGWIPELSTIRF